MRKSVSLCTVSARIDRQTEEDDPVANSPMKRIVIDDLPEDPLAAASVFHQHWLPHAKSALEAGEDVVLIFAEADFTHEAWRLAAVQGLARSFAPRRINAVTGSDKSLAAMTAYLDDAPGVTGQYLQVEPS
jgi:hypothetical protein